MDYVQKCPLRERLGILVPAGERERIAIRFWERGDSVRLDWRIYKTGRTNSVTQRRR
jgi:hypothetical protein